MNTAGATRPASTARTATPGPGDGLRRTTFSFAESSKERNRARGVHTLALLTLNGIIGLAHRPQSFELGMTISTMILV
jgi:hypothetical protein